MRMIGKIFKEMKWVMRTNESARTKGKHHHGKGISPKMSKDRGIWHSVREKMIKHNRKGSHDERSVILTWQTPGDREGPIQWRLECITHHHMAWWWCGIVQWWHDWLVTMELVLLWYKTWRHVGLVIQSLLLTTTHQLPNQLFTSLSNMPMTNSHTFQSASGLNTITRPTLKRSGGDYPSGQQVCCNKFGLLSMKTDLLRLRSMTWSLLTSPWPRSSRPWEWTTIFGCKPSLTMKNSRGSGEWSWPILTNDSCGESSGWGWSIQRQERRS